MDTEKLQELLTDSLRDLYDAENRLIRALPKMAKAAESEELRKGFTEHLEATRKQSERIEKVFGILGESAQPKACKGMLGIIEEGEQHMEEHKGEEDIDAVLIAGARKVEHYEIAAYTAAIELADLVGNRQVSRLIQQTLSEEERMDRKLAQISARLLKRMIRKAA
jgi:ferritin-like metal-binding protein YciE